MPIPDLVAEYGFGIPRDHRGSAEGVISAVIGPFYRSWEETRERTGPVIYPRRLFTFYSPRYLRQLSSSLASGLAGDIKGAKAPFRRAHIWTPSLSKVSDSFTGGLKFASNQLNLLHSTDRACVLEFCEYAIVM